MSRIITTAIIVIALAVPVWAQTWQEDKYGNVITDAPDGNYINVSITPYDPITPLEARIAKLEAELQRVAALVYTIHGAIEWGPDGWKLFSTCEMQIPEAFDQRIDDCLSNVTIEEK